MTLLTMASLWHYQDAGIHHSCTWKFEWADEGTDKVVANWWGQHPMCDSQGLMLEIVHYEEKLIIVQKSHG